MINLAEHEEYNEAEEEEGQAKDDSGEYTYEDEGVSLVVQRLMYTPHKEDVQRHNIFKTRCTVNQRVCDLIIDGGSSENIVSRTMVDKLQLPTRRHPSPYSIGWIRDVGETKVTEQCVITFCIGNNYKDEVLCDIVDMDACHMLLGRPWQFDLNTTHKGKDNTYTFYKDKVKIVLAPMRREGRVIASPSKADSLLIVPNIRKDAQESKIIYALVVKGEEKGERKEEVVVPEQIKPLLAEFQSLVPYELPAELPPMRNIQHEIDFVPGASLPNLPHYRMSPKEF